MSRYENVAVPFVKVGNRRGMTAQQLEDDPALKAFVNRFPNSFELSVTHDIWLLVEPPKTASRVRELI